MKNIIKFLFAAITMIMIWSCEKDEDQAVINEITKASASSDKTTVVLNEVIGGNAAIAFTWTKPIFNIAVVPTQQLEFGIKGQNFKKSIDIDAGTELTKSITHAELNAAMYSLGATPDVTNQIEARLKTSVGTAYFYSNVINLVVTPYTPNPDLVYPKINVPGSYAGAAGYADWTPGNSPNLFSPEKNDKYRGFIWINTVTGTEDGKYKFAINQDWPGNKGDDGTLTGKLKADGDNIKAPVAGTYYIKVDWTANTYSSIIANFGVIGDATPTGWASDTDFVYNPATKKYVINSIALNTSGVFKFRANDDWAMKFQPQSSDQILTSGSGVVTYLSSENTVTGDPNYKVDVAGNYKIELDVHNSANYKLTITKL
ncbi:SusE domain-containing protein [Flavobacterium sp. B17]|uniref:SusE domain-containing protein n=1 Tax=Flavobacterium sp. B17 TaxID=95618 RepID=UPI0005B26DF3|nr:SusE domain-containing protein [Flavobacterium sp. B17]